ncbi:restriction endonuclease subunit S [Falsihalocynthiibacter sp. SS001]|uniref:restriction endonuclease subunit S n=1 Tax=Falsihalocynthiibacter sp. SS001 TaxID=3349698 RepID=UPI0036D3E393
MIDWEETTLGDVAEILSAKRVFARDYVDNGVPFWRGKEVVELSAGRDVSTELFISEETYQNLGKKAGFPSAGDILLTSVGTLGRVYRLTPKDRIYFKDGNLTWFRNFSERICPQWLLYWLRSSAGQRALDSSKIGSTQQALTIVNLKKIPFLCPPKVEQEKIAATLSSIDDKIELNRRMNKTLEEMARALFRDWFVDFGPTRRQMEGATDPTAIMGQAFRPEKAATLAPLFPAKLGEDGLPVGWETRTLNTVVEQQRQSVKPNQHLDEMFEHFSLPAFDKAKWPTSEHGAEIKSNKTAVPPNSLLVSKLNPRIERVWVPQVAGEQRQICSTEFLCFRPAAGLGIATVEALFRSDEMREKMEAMVTGTSNSHQRVPPKVLTQTDVLLPKICTKAFEEVALPLLDKRQANEQENQTLAEMRDLLLPKLMSGEIRLKDAEAAV